MSAVNAALGIPAAGFGNDAAADTDISFGDVLGKVVNASADIVPGETEEQAFIPGEEVVEGSGEAGFAELTEELAEKIGNIDEDVISAAVQLLLSVGRAVERFFGSEADIALGNMGEPSGNEAEIFAIFTGGFSDVSGEAVTGGESVALTDESALPGEAAEESSMAEILIEDVADVIEEGISEGMDVEEVIDAVGEILSGDGDEDGNSLANAVVTVLCAISGINVSAEDFDLASAVENISPEAVEKFSDIAEVMASDMPAVNKAELISGILSEKAPEETEVKFADYIQKPESISFVHTAKDSAAAGSLKINDASAQADEISGNKGVPYIPGGIDVPAGTSGAADGGVINGESVFRELGEYVNTQLTSEISGEIPVYGEADGVKELTVVLRPRSLGEVAVKITADAGGAVSIILSAANAEVGKAISENAAALSESLTKQNIEVRSINVVNPSEASSYMNLDFGGQGFSRGEYSENGSESGSYSGEGRAVDGVSSDTDASDAARAAKLLKEAKLWATA